MTYVVLLRGINVGGKNRVSMAQLKAVLEQAGHNNVQTYINSGNIILDSPATNKSALQTDIEALLEAEFGFAVKTLVIARENFIAIARAIPAKLTNDASMKCDVLFLWDKYRAKEVVATLPVRKGIDTVVAVDGAIIWGVKRANATRSGLLKIVGTDLYAHMTIRNCNTTRKLCALLEP